MMRCFIITLLVVGYVLVYASAVFKIGRPCPGGQIRVRCASACTKTCQNPNPVCIRVCRLNKCQCPFWRPIWHRGRCITSLQCPRLVRPFYCYHPKIVGPCRARIPRYYYDRRTRSCRKFYYGGCRGNRNNFKSYFECRSRCRAFFPIG